MITAFEAAEEKVHASEDGCLLYALHEGPDGRLVIIKKCADQAAVDAHLEGEGLADLSAALGASWHRRWTCRCLRRTRPGRPTRARFNQAPARLIPGSVQEKQQRSVKRLWLASGSRRWQWLSGGPRNACPSRCTAR